MEKIFAPWRMEFIKSKKPNGCVLCGDSAREAALVLREDAHSFVIMNKYPYTSGHIMIAPRRHIRNFEELSPEERTEIFDLLAMAIKILKSTLKPEGFNIGMNLGMAGGAGIEDHLHVHVVPRWGGDCNFMTTLADTRVIPQTIEETYNILLPHFKKPGGKA